MEIETVAASGTEDPLMTAMERLREYPEFQMLIEDMEGQREEKFASLGETVDSNRIHQIVGEISILHDLATLFRG
jgi:hypothetical protein